MTSFMTDKPALNEIYEQVKGDMGGFSSRFGSERVLAHAVSGAVYMLSGYAEKLSQLAVPDSEDPEILMHWCSLFGIERMSASSTEISAEIESSEPVFLPAGSTWRHDSGVVFSLIEAIELDGCTQVLLRSQTKGSLENITPDSCLNIAATTPGLTSSGRVVRVEREGFDTESLDGLRERLRERLRRPPQGGCAYDYINWALENPAISRAWVLPRPPDQDGKPQNGHVNIAVAKEQGATTQTERQMIENSIKERCPISAIPHVVAMSEKQVDVELELEADASISKDNLKEKIYGELSFMIQRLAAPRGYLDKDLQKVSGTIHLSAISAALSLIPEIKHHRIIKPKKHVVPSEDGQIIVLGKVKL